jgi:hypothetical protein
LDSLYPGEITDIPGFVKASSRLKNAIEPHVCALLAQGISVVLDFPGNTKSQRAWFRRIFERASVGHDCILWTRLTPCVRVSSGSDKSLPPGAPWTTDAEFDAITAYFQPPSGDEGFNVVRHERA